MSKKTEQTREHILTVGRELISAQGFTALGLGQLLKEAKVPKGSFYHYFESKEDFGIKLLERYVEDYHDRLDALWASDKSGRARLADFFDQWVIRQSADDIACQCLVVKLGAEVSDMSDAMRSILAKGADEITIRIQQQIEAGIKDGSLSDLIDPQETAAMLYQMWLGASLLVKLEAPSNALEIAKANSEKLLPTP